MQAYQINELERLTGIKAHTIRIWEKRYSLITPSRTTTNRRYYNDEQVRKLLNVTTLLSAGHKISRIAAYTDAELNGLIQNNGADADQQSRAAYTNNLIKFMLAFDQLGFEREFAAALQQFGIYDAMLNVIYPFLNKTSILWIVNKAAPAQEHFATCIIRRKLMALTDALPMPVKKERFMLFLPPGEWHEIGLLFANYLICGQGYETIYLGQNVPIENIKKMAAAIAPDHMLLFYIATRPGDEIDAHIKTMAGISKSIRVLIAGNHDLLERSKFTAKNVTRLNSVYDLMELLKRDQQPN